MGDQESTRDATRDADHASVAQIYFIALSEWRLTPEYINDEWTPEILWLMFRERRAYLERQEAALALQVETNEPPKKKREPERRVRTDVELFEIMGINPTKH